MKQFICFANRGNLSPKGYGNPVPSFQVCIVKNKGGETMEEIKRIEGFEDYGVTTDGKVISYKHKTPRVLAGFINKGGYTYVDLCKDNKTTRFGVHQLVAKAYVDGWFEGAVVNHINGVKSNNDYTNLEWITQKENIHQGYITSGLGAMRNYKYHIIEYPDGRKTKPIPGQQPIKEYIKEHDLDVSFNSLLRNGKSRGFKLHTLD